MTTQPTQTGADAASPHSPAHELGELIVNYVQVLRMELADVRSAFEGPEAGNTLLIQSVERVGIVAEKLLENAGKIGGKHKVERPLTPEVVKLTDGYAAVGGLIEDEVVNLRARFSPETDPAVGESLRRIADLAGTIKQAGADVRGAAHG